MIYNSRFPLNKDNKGSGNEIGFKRNTKQNKSFKLLYSSFFFIREIAAARFLTMAVAGFLKFFSLLLLILPFGITAR